MLMSLTMISPKDHWQKNTMTPSHPNYAGGELLPVNFGVPSDFMRIAEQLHPDMDRKIGYFGNAPFVLFYFDPELDEV